MQHVGRGDEEAGGQVHGALRERDAGKQRAVDQRLAILRRAVDGLDEQVADGQHRRRWRGRQRAAVLVAPGVGVEALELGHDRAFDPHVGIAPGLVVRAGAAGRRRVLVDLADVDAAGDADAPVHAKQLAVIAPVRVDRHAPVRAEGVVFEGLDAGGAETVEDGLIGADGAPRVVDQVDGDAAGASRDQEVGELAASLVVELVAFHVDAGLRVFDDVAHGGKGRGPVDQKLDPVAGHKRMVRVQLTLPAHEGDAVGGHGAGLREAVDAQHLGIKARRHRRGGATGQEEHRRAGE